MHSFKPGIKHESHSNAEAPGPGIYTLGLKLIFIYAEYSGPTLFASLMNICIANVPELLEHIKVRYNWHRRTALFYLKLTTLAKLLSRFRTNRINLWLPEAYKKESELTALSNIESVRLDYG